MVQRVHDSRLPDQLVQEVLRRVRVEGHRLDLVEQLTEPGQLRRSVNEATAVGRVPLHRIELGNRTSDVEH